MAKTEKKLIANNKKHTTTILSWKSTKQESCSMEQK